MICKIKLVCVLLLFFGVDTDVLGQGCANDTQIPPTTPILRFADNDDGTVTDGKTGLMWAKCVEGLSAAGCTAGTAAGYTWQDALNLAAGKNLAGYGDWRLPNIKELQSIVERQCNSPAINLAVFPNTPNSDFWSTSLSSDNSNNAFSVNFNIGRNDNYHNREHHLFIRLVRSGQ